MNRTPVVITRPRSQAEPLAARLSELGIPTHVFPLLQVQPFAEGSPQLATLQAALARLADYALVAFVSPNAIDAAFAHIPAWPPDVIAAVVGDSSRQSLARHGISDSTHRAASPVDPERTDSETLLEVLDLPALRGKKALIVRAETGRELLADRLREAGVEVEQIAAYHRGAPVADDALLSTLRSLLAEPADWVITSSEALRNLHELVLAAGGAPSWRQMQQRRLFVPHPRIAETAESMGFDAVLRSGSGDEALIAAIQAIQSRT